MLTSIWSFLGWKEKPSLSPPPVTVTGVRIPADGTPAHLLSLTTITDSRARDEILFHVPDLHQYWKTEKAWEYRDPQRLDLSQGEYVPLSQYLRQRHDLKRLLNSSPFEYINRKQMFHLQQRYLLHYQHHALRPQHSSCIGSYYVFFSFASDDLLVNSSVPDWISIGADYHLRYHGDVFIVKMAPHEYNEHGWAVYEDINPQFLHLLVEKPQG
ncbi:hypothetical protein F5884DRAFT_39867 [Xylogone sp. PMI_703]|nr:hypothetical protein F5884DRAFT_39867 [Xylogone sp. PMI_703]